MRSRPSSPPTLVLVASTVLLGAAGLPGCAADVGASRSRGALTVVTAVHPLAWLARQVGGSHVTVTDLAGPGADPHHFELSPRQVIELDRSDLVLYIPTLQPSVDEAVHQHARDRAFDVTSQVQMLRLGAPERTGHQPEGEAGGREGHAGREQDTGGGHGTGGGRGAGSVHGAYDPHVWLDPVRFASLATSLGERLAEIDPARAEAYQHRAGELRDRLRALHRDYESGLRGCRTDTVITNHAAFGYLADRYNLDQVGIRTTADTDTEPSPARLAEVVELARKENARVIFYDSATSPDLARVVGREAGARTAELHTVSSRADGYFTQMRGNLRALHRALECS